MKMIRERNLDGVVVDRTVPTYTISKSVDGDNNSFILENGKPLVLYEVCDLLNKLDRSK